MKGKIFIDTKLCKGCEYCLQSCPKGVIELDTKSVNPNGVHPAIAAAPQKCTGCALCAEFCPEVAITVWRQGKATE